MDSQQFIASCINSAEHREIHGRTPEELDVWKTQFVDLQATLDDALVAMLYSVKQGDLETSRTRSALLLTARQNVLNHLEDL